MKNIFFCLLSVMAISIGYSQSSKLPKVQAPVFKKDSFNIIKYGAKSDGIVLNTKSINDAINACSRNGGGVVIIPSGFWLTGPVELKSNVNLYLQKNSVLQFTKDFDQYRLVEGYWEGVPQMRNQSPISATNATNIAITGFGIIDGNGDAWRMVRKDKLNETQWKKLVSSGGLLSDDKKTWYPSEKSLKGSGINNPGVISADKNASFYDDVKDFLRPNLVVLTRCKKILLEGVTFQNSPAWNLHPLMCEDLTVRNVYAKNPPYAQNGDGIDVESCKNVLIENSTFDVGDDGICIKSGRDEAGRKRNMPTENMLVRNCTVYHAHGGFVIGSEMSGGARNLHVENCTFIGTDIGLRFKTTRGRGGIVENIFVSNINMKDIVTSAILFDMYYEAKDPVVLVGDKRAPPKVETLPVTEGTPQFKNFYIKNIVCNGAAKAIFVRGLPEMNIKNILLQDMVLQADEGMDMTEASQFNIQNVTLITRNTNPVLNINNSNNISLFKINYNNNAEVLLNVTGERSNGIVLLNTDTKKAKKSVTVGYGAKEEAVKVN